MKRTAKTCFMVFQVVSSAAGAVPGNRPWRPVSTGRTIVIPAKALQFPTCPFAFFIVIPAQAGIQRALPGHAVAGCSGSPPLALAQPALAAGGSKGPAESLARYGMHASRDCGKSLRGKRKAPLPRRERGWGEGGRRCFQATGGSENVRKRLSLRPSGRNAPSPALSGSKGPACRVRRLFEPPRARGEGLLPYCTATCVHTVALARV